MKRLYNWHFWLENYKIQIVVPDSSYCGALKRVKELFFWYQKPKIKFQFGEKE